MFWKHQIMLHGHLSTKMLRLSSLWKLITMSKMPVVIRSFGLEIIQNGTYFFQIWGYFQYGTASLGWFHKWIWERAMVATTFQRIQFHNLAGGVKSRFNRTFGFLVNEICWQYCKGDSFHLFAVSVLLSVSP